MKKEIFLIILDKKENKTDRKNYTKQSILEKYTYRTKRGMKYAFAVSQPFFFSIQLQ